LLGAAVNANQPNQTFQINYTDGTSVTVTQSISLWTAPQNYAGESIAISAAYTDTSAGTNNPGEPANLYGYVLGLNNSKTVQSITLPNNPDVIVLAMSLANAPTAVSLTSVFNRAGIYTDGSSYSGGLDGGGYAYSAAQLGSSQIWDSIQFKFGPSNANDVINCAGQTITLPTNRYTSLFMLATGVNANQPSQSFTVTYTDGTTAQIVQSMSDWINVTGYSNQFTAVTMSYRLFDGSINSASTHLYGYLFPLNNTKTVRTFKLPSNANVNVLAITLANTPLPVSLQSNYNRAGIYTDGTSFGSSAGLDDDGSALSATLLGPSETWHNVLLDYGVANVTNVISAAGQTVALPQGQYSSLLMLGVAVNGSQASQSFLVTYTNGATSPFVVSLSDWVTPQGYGGETTVVQMGYRDSSGGSKGSPAVNVYGYQLNLNSNNVVQSIRLPTDSDVEVLAISLSNFTAVLPEAPVITSQPASLVVSNGYPAAFSVTAIGSPALHYQWLDNSVALTNGGNISGATTSALTLSTTSTNDAGSYSVIVSNAYGAVNSAVVTLTIGLPPSITNQPISLTVTNGSPAIFTVGASGVPPFAYQWQMNGTNLSDGANITGSVTSTLTLAAAGANDAGSYDVIITNGYGSVTSSVVALNVYFFSNPPRKTATPSTFPGRPLPDWFIRCNIPST
jgi:hypothetical protein